MNYDRASKVLNTMQGYTRDTEGKSRSRSNHTYLTVMAAFVAVVGVMACPFATRSMISALPEPMPCPLERLAPAFVKVTVPKLAKGTSPFDE
jgi:hypothetical protein